MTDITDLKSTEKELLESRNFLDVIINHIPVMLYVKDAATLNFYKANQACADFLGLSRKISGNVRSRSVPARGGTEAEHHGP